MSKSAKKVKVWIGYNYARPVWIGLTREICRENMDRDVGKAKVAEGLSAGWLEINRLTITPEGIGK